MNGQEPVTRTELHAELAEVRAEIAASEERMTGTMRQIETNLLTAFHSYAKGQQTRMHTSEVIQEELRTRMAALEDRILNLETRRSSTN
jgi:hypothetical protein